MDVWRKGCEYLSMLERKQGTLRRNIAMVENQLAQITKKIAELQLEYAHFNQQIKGLTPSGLVNRVDIYKGIRKQGALITQQQLVYHKISQLEDEKCDQEQTLYELQTATKVLDMKHYKISFYLQPLRREYLRRCDNNIENEVQELAGYGRKNF